MIGQNIPTLFNSQPFPSYDNSAADDIEQILSKNRKSLYMITLYYC